uniref:Cornifelin n=1 Tax=Paramormyrops kingsleyae TaxID=1676925 RepID=A0A3B3QAL0_9TELE
MEYQANVMTSQPQVTITSYTMTSQSSEWSSNLCDCCQDCGIGLCGAFIPCVLGCKVAEDHGETCCLVFLPGALVALRTSIRDKYRISGSICGDWVVMSCVPLCGLCQMAREQRMRS